LVWLEEKLRPVSTGNDSARDAVGWGILAALAAVLAIPVFVSPPYEAVQQRFLSDIAGQLTSPHMLLAMGMLLALRCGAIDLSVWISAAIGGLVAAALINGGVGTGAALLGGVGAGAGMGALSGVAVTLGRIPSVVATLIVALCAMWCAQAVWSGRSVAVEDSSFRHWHIAVQLHAGQDSPEGGPHVQQSTNGTADAAALPLSVTRMFLVAIVYSAVMLAMLAANAAARAGWRLSPRKTLFVALCASGALSAAGGVLWLLEYGSTPVPTRPIGDLRIPAAVILAGSLCFAGRGRTLLAGICLPPAMLLATVWQQEVGIVLVEGYALHMLVLIAMCLAGQVAFVRSISPPGGLRWLRLAGSGLIVAGMLVFAAQASVRGAAARDGCETAGVIAWLGGTVAVVIGECVAAARQRRPATTAGPPDTEAPRQ
jgi:ribose/xylose/arabinose/galactoside ABC-type transport system permease subunit